MGMSHGIEEAAIMLYKIRGGDEFFHAIEIMACKGGCIGGGGQPKAIKKQAVLEARAEGLNNSDRSLKIRRSHDNPYVKALYIKKQAVLEARAEGLNNSDRSLKIRRSHDNPYVKALYEKYLDYPLSHKAHELLHTKYFPKIKNR